MAQIAIYQPWEGKGGTIHSDRSGRGDKCTVKGCPGKLFWTLVELEAGGTIYCDGLDRHRYKLELSG